MHKLKKVVASHAVANQGRGGVIVEILECKHAVVLQRAQHAKDVAGRECNICDAEETRKAAVVPPVKKREIAGLIKRLGGTEAVLEYLVRQEAIAKKARESMAHARAVKLQRIASAPQLRPVGGGQ